jgi:cbb3-type cytochrome oxidase maturation protein
MNALLVLIPVALALGLLGLAAFLWSLRSGQFDDLDGAAARILFDDPVSSDATAPGGRGLEGTKRSKQWIRQSAPR